MSFLTSEKCYSIIHRILPLTCGYWMLEPFTVAAISNFCNFCIFVLLCVTREFLSPVFACICPSPLSVLLLFNFSDQLFTLIAIWFFLRIFLILLCPFSLSLNLVSISLDVNSLFFEFWHTFFKKWFCLQCFFLFMFSTLYLIYFHRLCMR